VTAFDRFSNVATTYRGTAIFTSSDAQAVLPAGYTFTGSDNGQHTFSVTLKTAGSQSVTVADSANASVSGNASATVSPAAASSLAVAGFPTSAFVGIAADFTVTAHDAFGNVPTAYRGALSFS